MKNVFSIASVLLFLISCSKDGDMVNNKLVQVVSPTLKSDDPVIQKYTPFGTIELAPSSYSARLSSCTEPIGIYLFTPSEGPYEGLICEIYRYTDYSDISGPCGDEFNKKWSQVSFDSKTYYVCYDPGSDCEEFDGPNGCVLVHCDL